MEDIDNKTTKRLDPDLHLGCGGKAPLKAGKTKKICADCGVGVEVNADVFICPICKGPLGD